jgi:recombination protein RecA
MKTNVITSSELAELISRLGIRQGEQPAPHSDRWELDTLSGRIVELSSDGECAALSAAVSLMLEAQRRAEPAVWIAVGGSTFYPPDVARSGVDLASLPVVRVADSPAAARCADKLLRCGAFAVVVVDLGRDHQIRVPVQSRLAGLAKKHRSALLCLTKKKRDEPSIGSLVSLRGVTRVRKAGFDRFTWEIHVTKDKRQRPGWVYQETFRGPEGLC